MKIVSWNCHYGFDANKTQKIQKICPATDIFVIQECIKSDFDVLKTEWEFKNWYGDDLNNEESNLGIAIFSNKFEIEFTAEFNRNFRYVVPYHIKGGKEPFTLFAVWTKREPIAYEQNLYEALKYYGPFKDNTIIIGDYNVGSCEGKEDRYDKLKEKMRSVGLSNCAHDQEKGPTSMWNKEWYQNDYCFASEDLAHNAKFEIIKDKITQNLSDHCPIIVDFDL